MVQNSFDRSRLSKRNETELESRRPIESARVSKNGEREFKTRQTA